MRFRLRFLLLTFVALLVPLSLAAQADIEAMLYQKNVRIQVLSSGANTIEFEVVNENTKPPTDAQSRILNTSFVAVPIDSEVQYRFKELEWELYWPGGETEGPFGMDDESSVGPVSPNMVRAVGTYMGEFRSVGLAQLNVTVTSLVNLGAPDYRRGIQVLKRGVLEATVTGPGFDEPTYPANLQERDPYLINFAKHLVVNPDMVTTYTRALPPMDNIQSIIAWNEKLKTASQNGPILLSRVTHPGIHRISPRALSNQGMDPAKFKADGIRIFAGNIPLRTIETDLDTGPFVGTASLSFYVPDIFPRGERYIPVWMMQLPEDEAQLMETVAYPAEGEFTSDNVNITTEVEIFEPNFYNKKLPFTANTSQWTSLVIGRGKFESISFDVEGLDATTSGSIAVNYSGMANAERHIAQLYINGVQIGGEEVMTGLGPFPRSYQIAAGILREGRNVITVHFPQTNEPTVGAEVAMTSARVTYPVDARRAPANHHLTISAAPGTNVQFRFARPLEVLTAQRYLLDVADPYAPRLLATTLTREYNTVYVHARLTVGAESAKLYYSDDQSVRHFSRFRPVVPEELLEPEEGADMIIVAHPGVLEGITEYAQMRRNGGMKVSVISSDAIMQQFNFGATDYLPIRDFLKYAFNSWPGRRVSKVLLVGESSEYPWHDLKPNPDVAPNLVPAFGFFDQKVVIHSDDSYAQLTDDALADLEIGRFSVTTAAQAQAISHRIWEYETAPPPGPWQTRHLFITDDEPEFARVAESIIGAELNYGAQSVRLFLQDQPYEDYFRIFNRKRSIAMTQAIIDALSDGALTACYLGHGGPNLWSGERIFHYRDIPLLRSEGRRPIMTAASCDTSWIDYPVEPVRQSLGEHFVLEPEGGGISVFAPVAGTSSYEHDFLLRPFYEALNDRKMHDLGSITLYSKLKYMLNRGQSYVSNQFILLGDPALKIPRPTSRIELQLAPRDLFVNQEAPLTIQGTTPTIQWGVVEAEILDLKSRELAGPVRATIESGRFKTAIELPKFIEPGEYRLVVHAYNKGNDKFETLEQRLRIMEPSIDIEWSMDPPANSGLTAGQPVALKLKATNATPGYMDHLIMSIRDARTDSSLTSAPLVLAPGDTLEWNFRIPAPPGINLIEAVVDYRNKQAGQMPVARGLLEFRVADPRLPLVSVPEKQVEVQLVAAPDRTEFTLPLYNMAGAPLSDIRAQLYLLDRPGGSPVGEEDLVTSLDTFGDAKLKFTARTRFPEGDLPFRLDVKAVREDGQEATQSIQPLIITLTKGNDLVVVPGSVVTERKDYVKGQTVYVLADIRNDGKTEAANVQTTLYVDYPWEETAVAPSIGDKGRIVFDRPLAPGETRRVRLRWDPPPGSNLNARMYVVTNSNRAVLESDYTNNMSDVAVSLLRLPNLALDFPRVRLTQEFVRPGDVVGITVPYKNDSPFDFAHPFVIELRAQGAELAEELIYRGTFEKMDAGEEGLIQTAWRADGLRDTIYISLNDDRDYGEQEIGDNVARKQVTYVLNNKFVQQDLYTWSFSPTFHYGKRTSLYVAPDDSLILTQLPDVRKKLMFSNEYIVGNPIPEGDDRRNDDNVMSIVDGALHWSPYETPAPAKFRIPMPQDDETTLYDLYLLQLPAVSPDGLPNNHYRYLVEDETEWRSPELRSISSKMGRIETRDDYLDITFAPDSIPSWNSIFSIDAAPVQGDFLSAVYEVDRLPEGTFHANAVTPPGTKIVYNIRVGTGDVHEPGFSDWMAIEPGDALPAGEDVSLFQLRTMLVGNEDGLPVLKDIIFKLKPEQPEIAGMAK